MSLGADGLFPNESFSYLQVHGKYPEVKAISIYEKAYELWRNVWEETFTEVLGKGEVVSDDWLSKDKISILCYQSNPIGIFFHNWYDLLLTPHWDHTYFSHYPAGLKVFLKGHNYKKIMSISYLTVHKEWRRRQSGFSTADILVSLACMDLVESDAQAMITNTHNSRKTDRLGKRHGARIFLPDYLYHGLPSSALLFERQTCHVNQKVGNLVHYLWTNRNQFDREGIKIA
jgi:hypothetical protein